MTNLYICFFQNLTCFQLFHNLNPSPSKHFQKIIYRFSPFPNIRCYHIIYNLPLLFIPFLLINFNFFEILKIKIIIFYYIIKIIKVNF
jgi:hypothetical protein